MLKDWGNFSDIGFMQIEQDAAAATEIRRFHFQNYSCFPYSGTTRVVHFASLIFAVAAAVRLSSSLGGGRWVPLWEDKWGETHACDFAFFFATFSRMQLKVTGRERENISRGCKKKCWMWKVNSLQSTQNSAYIPAVPISQNEELKSQIKLDRLEVVREMRAYQFLEWCGGLSFHPPSSPMKNWNENWKFYIGSSFNSVTCSTRSSHPPSTDFPLRSTFPPIPTKKRVAKNRIERETVSSSFHVWVCFAYSLSLFLFRPRFLVFFFFLSFRDPILDENSPNRNSKKCQRSTSKKLSKKTKKMASVYLFIFVWGVLYPSLVLGCFFLPWSLAVSFTPWSLSLLFLLFPFSISMPTSLFPPFPPRRYSFQYGSVMGGRGDGGGIGIKRRRKELTFLNAG